MAETPEPGWGTVAWEFTERFGWTVSLMVVGVLVFIWKFDAIKSLFHERAEAKINEREQNWDEVQALVHMYAEDNARLRTEIERLRTQVDSLFTTIASIERGNSRLRHALNNVCADDAAIRLKLRRVGEKMEPFPARLLFELDDEYGDRLRAIMADYDDQK